MKDKNKDKIRVSVWLTEAENEKLKLSGKTLRTVPIGICAATLQRQNTEAATGN